MWASTNHIFVLYSFPHILSRRSKWRKILPEYNINWRSPYLVGFFYSLPDEQTFSLHREQIRQARVDEEEGKQNTNKAFRFICHRVQCEDKRTFAKRAPEGSFYDVLVGISSRFEGCSVAEVSTNEHNNILPDHNSLTAFVYSEFRDIIENIFLYCKLFAFFFVVQSLSLSLSAFFFALVLLPAFYVNVETIMVSEMNGEKRD